jgi:hypothetical protein
MSLGGYRESLPEIAFQSLGLVRGGVATRVYLGVFLFTTGNRFKISVVETRESDRVPLTDTKSNSLRRAELC